MLELINRIFVVLLILLALGGIFASFAMIGLELLGSGVQTDKYMDMSTLPSLYLDSAPASISPDDSPYQMNMTVNTPPLAADDLLYLEGYADGKKVAEADCLAEFDYESVDYVGMESLDCVIGLPYSFNPTQEYEIYAVLHSGGEDYYAGPSYTTATWSGYESTFWGVFLILLCMVVGAYLLIVVPLGLYTLNKGMHTRHQEADEGEYTLSTLLNPFGNRKGLLNQINSFLVSPWFWGLEGMGILLILFYLFLSAEAWRNGAAFGSFAVSGLVAFIVPFLWCVAFWFADFREREPLRILVTFFLWGCLTCLMAIGINSFAGVLFELIGIGFLGSLLIAPPVEEFFKGTGLTLLSEHHEFDSVEDGMMFGFVIGMGFSFIENWLYLIGNPFSADIGGWFVLFIMRSLAFSANHGLYTAVTGGFIGMLRERRFGAPALGLIPGATVAASLHAVHNSGEFLIALLGLGGVLAYCCVLVPLVDYGGLIIVLLVFAWAVLRKRKAPEK